VVELHAETSQRGPVFDGTAAREVGRYLQEVKNEVADEGVRLVRSDYALKHRYLSSPPTGRARDNVMIEPGNNPSVTSGGIVYDAWLEGVSERNRATRFKGYHTFRRMTRRLDAEADRIAALILPPFLRRMDGR
jgi:hypothetical protein